MTTGEAQAAVIRDVDVKVSGRKNLEDATGTAEKILNSLRGCLRRCKQTVGRNVDFKTVAGEEPQTGPGECCNRTLGDRLAHLT